MDETVQALADLPDTVAAAVVARLPHGVGMRILSRLDDERIAVWLGQAGLDDALAILLHVDAGHRTRILDVLPNRRTRRTLRRLLVFPPDSVGATLNPAAIRLDAGMALRDAVALLRRDELESEQPMWLVDGEGVYRGRLDLGRALMARSDRSRLRKFLVDVKPLRGETTLLSARDHGEWLDHAELPVVDELGHLLGSISRARLMAALESIHPSDPGLADGVSELVRQYFRIMGTCIGDLFSPGRTQR
jgi:magnesium transporter